jgi:hypothetical protein
MGLAVVWMLAAGLALLIGKKVPAPKGLTDAHRLGMIVITLASLAGIICMLVGY